MQLPDLDEQLHLRRWTRLIKFRANGRCEKCGVNYDLESHHIDRDRTNNCLRNGMCLCMICHGLAHFINSPYEAEKIIRSLIEK